MPHQPTEYTLWEDETFAVFTLTNPHQPYSDGVHLIVGVKVHTRAAWDNPELAGAAFTLASRVCKVIEELGINPWFNLQANGNWGLLPGSTPHFHIHIYGRVPSAERWAQPLVLPELPGTYEFEGMPEAVRVRLSMALQELLG